MKSIAFSIFPFLFLLMSMLFLNSCTNDCDSIKNCSSEFFFADTCVLFDKNELVVTQDSVNFYLTNNGNFKLDFEFKNEAEEAMEIIKNYNFTEYCIIGTDTSFSYFLSNGQIPEGDYSGEDCLSHELCQLKVEFINQTGKYTVVDGGARVYASTSQDTAMQILSTLKFFKANFGCYVGRPKTKMHYMKH